MPRKPQRPAAALMAREVDGPAPDASGRGSVVRSRVSALNVLSLRILLCQRERAVRTEHRVAQQRVPATDVVRREEVRDRLERGLHALTGLRLREVDRALEADRVVD